MTGFTISIQLLLSFLFFLSAYAKTVRISDFYWELMSYRLLPGSLVKRAMPLLLAFEFALSALILMPVSSSWKTATGVACLALFTAGLWRKRRFSPQTSCTCFGSVGWLNRYPFTRNAVLMLLFPGLLVLPNSTLPGLWCWIAYCLIGSLATLTELLSSHPARERGMH